MPFGNGDALAWGSRNAVEQYRSVEEAGVVPWKRCYIHAMIEYGLSTKKDAHRLLHSR